MKEVRVSTRLVAVSKAAIILGVVLFTLRGPMTLPLGAVALSVASGLLMIVCGWRLAMVAPGVVIAAAVVALVVEPEATVTEVLLSLGAVLILMLTLAGASRSVDGEYANRWRVVIPLAVTTMAATSGLGYLARDGIDTWPTWLVAIFWLMVVIIVVISAGVSLVALQLADRGLDRMSSVNMLSPSSQTVD